MEQEAGVQTAEKKITWLSIQMGEAMADLDFKLNTDILKFYNSQRRRLYGTKNDNYYCS